jgi:hypothetical protein
MSTKATTRMSVYVPKRLAILVEKVAGEEKTSKSALVVRLLENLEEEREKAFMEEGYRALAEEQKEIAQLAFRQQADIALRQ